MRSCLLINHTPLVGSGSGTYTRSVADALKNYGYRVHILTPGEKTSFESISESLTVSSICLELPELRKGQFPSFTGHPSSALLYSGMSLQQVESYCDQMGREILRLVDSLAIDLLHVQHFFLLAGLKSLIRKPILVTSHGSELDFIRQNIEKGWVSRLMAEASNVDGLIFISRFVKLRFEELNLDLACPTYIVPNGYDNRIFSPRASHSNNLDPVLIAAGRFVKYKRFDLYLNAISYLRRRRPHFKAYLIGDGPEKAALEQRARETAVIMRGFLSPEELSSCFREANLTIMPSENEPFGLVALESIGCGCPVLGSATGGLAEIIKPWNGELVSGWEPEHWAERIDSMLDSNFVYAPHEIAESVRPYTWDATAESLARCYDQC